MKKILIVITTAFVPYGGLTTVMMNYYRAMDKSGLKIDFASTNEPCKELLDELKQNNSEYFCLGKRKNGLLPYLHRLDNLLKEKNYDVVHVNGNSATMCLELNIAKKHHVPVRIAHGHNTSSQYSLLHKLLNRSFHKSYTHAAACSSKAGDWLYKGGNYIVFNNAINVNRYKFNAEIRNKYRKSLKIEDKFVVGTVGKLNKQKNHAFLLEIFAELKKDFKDACLLIVGGGPLESMLKDECKKLKVENDVIFTGMTNDSSGYLQAMDIFVMPSLWEGLPLAMLEAQAAGLPCIISDNVTEEAKCTNNVVYKNLDDIKGWIKEIKIARYNNVDRNIKFEETFVSSGFDIKEVTSELRGIYLS